MRRFLLFVAVALVAPGGKDRLNVAREIDFFSRGGRQFAAAAVDRAGFGAFVCCRRITGEQSDDE